MPLVFKQKFSFRFRIGSGVYNVKAAYYDATNVVYFDDVLTIDMGSISIVESLTLGSASEGDYNINATVLISSGTLPVCGILDFGDNSTKIMFYRSQTSSECKDALDVASLIFEEYQLEAGATSWTKDHKYT